MKTITAIIRDMRTIYLVRYLLRSRPNLNEIIGSEEKNNYLSPLKVGSICSALP